MYILVDTYSAAPGLLLWLTAPIGKWIDYCRTSRKHVQAYRIRRKRHNRCV